MEKETKTEINVNDHILVPKHSILNEKEREELFKRYKVTMKELPKILITDPAIQGLKPKIGDIIKVTRPSSTAGEVSFYRGVINA